MQISQHPAVTMLEQLGGNRFLTMTGAKDLMSSDNPQPRLTMRLPANLTKKRGTHMEISLLPTDEYLMVFFKMKRRTNRLAPATTERDIIEVCRGVQVEQLRPVFEDMTGLCTSL